MKDLIVTLISGITLDYMGNRRAVRGCEGGFPQVFDTHAPCPAGHLR
jgi:hypothetical protein